MKEHKPNSAQPGTTAWFDRFFAIPGLTITSCACYTLLALRLVNYRGSEHLLAWTGNHPTQVTIAIQILSQTLGLIHVHVLCLMFRTGFVLYSTANAFPIYLTQLVQAASTIRMTWSLPWKLCIPLLFVVLSSFVPAPIWAASMTPLSANHTVERSLRIPSFDASNLSEIWKGNLSTSVTANNLLSSQWETSQGTFSFDVLWFKGAFLQSAAGASVGIDGTKKHAKIDKTGFSYIDRSYGTGSIGGFDSFDNIQSPTSFEYDEYGLRSDINCFYNSSIKDTTHWIKVYSGDAGLLYQLVGYDAFGNDHYYSYYTHTEKDLFGWLNGYDTASRTGALVLSVAQSAEGDPRGFNALNNMQCHIKYLSDLFTVNVNRTGKTIHSIPSYIPDLPWPRYADNVTHGLKHWLWRFTITDDCVEGSQIGRSLVVNGHRLRNATSQHDAETVLRATEDFLGSLIDDSW